MKIVASWLCSILLTVSAANAMELPQNVRDALRQARIPESSVGIVVRPIDANTPLLQINASRSMSPASTMKLLTTYAGLELLGPGYSWKTEAWMDGRLDDNGVLHGNLVIKGYGDPKITVEQLWMWLHELRNRGLREVDGNLVLDRSAFQARDIDPGAFDNDPTRAYNVGPDALLLNFNAVRLIFMPGDRNVAIATEPALAGYVLDNRVMRKGRYRCADWDDNIHVELNGNTILVRGNYPVNCGEHDKPYSLLPHLHYFDAVFRAVWQEVGGTIRGATREGNTPETATLLSTHYSQPLSELIRDINKFSNNVMARQLFLSLGASYGGPAPSMDLPESEPAAASAILPDGHDGLGTLIHPVIPGSIERSEQAIQDWLKHKGLSFPELVLENGAGLSRSERISPLSMSQLLFTMQQSPLSAEIEASLPIVGVDGTMRKRLDNCPATSHAHLKTGSLEGVKSIAGFVNSRSGRQWIVVFLINHPNAAAGQRAQDALVEWVEEQ